MNLAVENNLGVDLQSAVMVLIATLIIILIAKKYFWNVVIDYMEKRKQLIESEYTKAQTTKEEANAFKQAYEAKLEDAHVEASKILQVSKNQANVEYQTIVQKAKVDANQLIEKAKDEIAFEKRKAEKEMNDKIKDVAFSAAEKLIKENINESTKVKFVDEFLSEVDV